MGAASVGMADGASAAPRAHRRWRLVVAVAAVAIEWLRCQQAIWWDETCAFDWDAYMEQVARVWGGAVATAPAVPAVAATGTFNYSALHGDTGALVYPAGHVWLHSAWWAVTRWDAARWTTEYVPKPLPGYEGRVTRPHAVLAGVVQQAYAALYAVLLSLVWLLYDAMAQPTMAQPGGRAAGSGNAQLLRSIAGDVTFAVMLALARRSRETAALGLFNDVYVAVASYAAILLIARRRWLLGCIVYSLAVSIKMNALLYAPALAWLLLQHPHAPLANAIVHVAVCALVQLVLALPFLTAAPLAYLAAAFNLGRAFEQRWSVNWAWLPPAIFASRGFSWLLLGVLLAMLVRWGGAASFRCRARSRTAPPPSATVAVASSSGAWERVAEAAVAECVRVVAAALPVDLAFGGAGGDDAGAALWQQAPRLITTGSGGSDNCADAVAARLITRADGDEDATAAAQAADSRSRERSTPIRWREVQEAMWGGDAADVHPAPRSTSRLDAELGLHVHQGARRRRGSSGGTVAESASPQSQPLAAGPKPPSPATRRLATTAIIWCLLCSNVLGVAAARSLHFQFQIWYYHAMALLLTHTLAPLPRFVVLLALELGWGSHPPSAVSSGIVTACHIVAIASLEAFVASPRDSKDKGGDGIGGGPAALPLLRAVAGGGCIASGQALARGVDRLVCGGRSRRCAVTVTAALLALEAALGRLVEWGATIVAGGATG